MAENTEFLEKSTEDTIERPPKPPGPSMGPYFQFLTTDLKKMLWFGSALIFQHVSLPRPSIKFDSTVNVNSKWEILYDNLFSMRAYRININIKLDRGEGDEKIDWKVDWGDCTTNGTFYIARYDQKWRGAYFSCNGFDATVTHTVANDLAYNSVWDHLLSVHDTNPFHLLVWGGDQVYCDSLLEDNSFLLEWIGRSWGDKWQSVISENDAYEIEQYYFYNYAQHWERRPEMKKALGSVPSLMMWDDHESFDGAGSYPPLLQKSRVMTGLFEIAQKMRLLFQHHTTPHKARQHRLFGYRGYNFLAQCGPNLVLLGTDGRSERDHETVTHENTWNMIFEKLDTELENVQHLIVLVAVPFAFERFKMLESCCECFNAYSMACSGSPFCCIKNSVFGVPEPYDDLRDAWVHAAHIAERDRVLARLQQFAEKKQTRITLFSGDVHCCGVGRFRTRENRPVPVNDPKLMYQVISSAIVNKPPKFKLICSAHCCSGKWHPNDDTEEELIKFFEHAPEYGANICCRKLLCNRNWCSFEECVATDLIPRDGCSRYNFCDYIWLIIDLFLICICLGGCVRRKWTRRTQQDALHEQRNASSSNTTKTQKELRNYLKVRLWLENKEKKDKTIPFSYYDLYIPDLKAIPDVRETPESMYMPVLNA